MGFNRSGKQRKCDILVSHRCASQLEELLRVFRYPARIPFLGMNKPFTKNPFPPVDSHSTYSLLSLHLPVCVCVCVCVCVREREKHTRLRMIWFHLNPILQFFLLVKLFMHLFLAVLGLHSSARAFSSCGKQGLLSDHVGASHCSGFSCGGAWALGMHISISAALGRAQ